MEILRNESRGDAVRRWQNFLIGSGYLRGSADGAFGHMTESATKRFQRENGLRADGVAGPKTLGAALLKGFDPGLTDPVGPRDHVRGVHFPPPPRFRSVTTTKSRQRRFGTFRYKPAPTSSNPEGIEIIGNWEKENIVTVFIPQLKGVPVFGKPSSGRMKFHRKAADQLKALWQAWEDEGLLDRVLSYEGSYNPRFQRGSTTELSNHAFGTAFDINAKWNSLGAVPALVGQEGSVRELVEIANAHGFYWGGHFKKRPDGMHFEVAKPATSSAF